MNRNTLTETPQRVAGAGPALSGARAFVSIKTQFENVGDALIVRELVRLVAERALTTIDLSRCPASFQATLGLHQIANVSTYTRMGKPRLLWSLLRSRLRHQRCYYFLMPGGRGGEISRLSYAKARMANIVLACMRGLGVRICHVGVSYDHLGPRHTRMLALRSALLWSHAVRDDITREYLQSLGIHVHAVIPDLALNLVGTTLSASPDRHAVAFSFRQDKYPHQATLIAQVIQRIIGSAGAIQKVKFTSQVRRDNGFMHTLSDQFRNLPDVSVEYHECADDIDRCKSIYADCQAIYSNRLHALLLAAAVGCVPIALILSPLDVKIVGVFEGLGLSEHVVRLHEGADDSLPVRVDLDMPSLLPQKQALSGYFDALLAE